MVLDATVESVVIEFDHEKYKQYLHGNFYLLLNKTKSFHKCKEIVYVSTSKVKPITQAIILIATGKQSVTDASPYIKVVSSTFGKKTCQLLVWSIYFRICSTYFDSKINHNCYRFPYNHLGKLTIL